MARVPLGDASRRARARILRDACGSAPHASYLEAALARVSRRRDDRRRVRRRCCATLLEPLEIAVLDASHPRGVARASAAAPRASARDADARRARRCARASEAIAPPAITPQVEEVPGLSLVFVESSTARSDGCRCARPRRSSARDGRRVLSPTVLLRPVVERAILPTAAYVGGPGRDRVLRAGERRRRGARAAVAARRAALVDDASSSRTFSVFSTSSASRAEDLADPARGRDAGSRASAIAPRTIAAPRCAARRRRRAAIERLRAANDGARVATRSLDGLRRVDRASPRAARAALRRRRRSAARRS